MNKKTKGVDRMQTERWKNLKKFFFLFDNRININNLYIFLLNKQI